MPVTPPPRRWHWSGLMELASAEVQAAARQAAKDIFGPAGESRAFGD